MQAQVKEWGNSQGIRLPKEILKSAGIALNDFLAVRGYKKIDSLPISEMINISDAIQGIFESI